MTALDALRELLSREGVLRSTPAEPVMRQDGSVAPWMFYSWNVSMDGHGMRVAVTALLDRLSTFRSTQLASHGVTGLPIVAGCVALGEERYSGLAVRSERKKYASRRLVEGRGDVTRPVVIVDDSIVSGRSLYEAISALEDEGYEVEGAVSLVTFAGRGGLEWANGRGYRAEALFEVGADLGWPTYVRSAPAPDPPPATRGGAPASPFAEGLHPASLARQVTEYWLRHRDRPQPPRTLDAEYNNAGGCFVSFRRRIDDHRYARDGHWHLPQFDGPIDARDHSPAADVVDATIETLRGTSETIGLTGSAGAPLSDVKIAVTFMGEAEEVLPARIDFERYALICTDLTGDRRGGALPNTQVFTSDAQQYKHALVRNARISPTEPHRLFRQEVFKHSEPNTEWLAYGQPDGADLAWTRSAEVGRILTSIALGHEAVELHLARRVEAVAVTFYRGGTRGTAVSAGPGTVHDLATSAARRARESTSAPTSEEIHDGSAAVAVTILHDAEVLGTDQAYAAAKLRRGREALRWDGADGSVRWVLPGAGIYNGWSDEQVVAAAQGKGRGQFTTYRTAAWISTADRVERMVDGFPAREERVLGPGLLRDTVSDLAGFVARSVDRRGRPVYTVDAVTGLRSWEGTGPRQVHALAGLERAARLLERAEWTDCALTGLRSYLDDLDPRPGGFAVSTAGALADAVVHWSIASPEHPLHRHPAVASVAARLSRMVRPSGVVSARPLRLTDPQDLTYLPGAALRGLAADPALLREITPETWSRCLLVHRTRWRSTRSWGQLSWQAQGWAAVHEHQHQDEQAAFVLELADWAVDRQVEVTGAYLEDVTPAGSSFNTGFIAEGVAAAWGTARLVGDARRVARYSESVERAATFLRRLIVEPRDTFVMARPDVAIGGMRLAPDSPVIRIDAVAHTLHALCHSLELATLDQTE